MNPCLFNSVFIQGMCTFLVILRAFTAMYFTVVLKWYELLLQFWPSPRYLTVNIFNYEYVYQHTLEASSSQHSDPPRSSGWLPGIKQLPNCLQNYLLYVQVPIQVTYKGHTQVFSRRAH